MNDDLTQQQKIQVGELRSISALTKRKGLESKVCGNTLFINGRRYGYGDVDRLLDGLTLEAAKTIPVDKGRGLGFQSKHSMFFNMSKCHIVYEGYDFNSAEDVYQYIRAKECGTREDVQNILLADRAYKAKSAGSEIRETAAWHRKKVQVMKEVLELKLQSDSGLKEKLINSADKDLYELTQDKFWGCGYSPSKADLVKQLLEFIGMNFEFILTLGPNCSQSYIRLMNMLRGTHLMLSISPGASLTLPLNAKSLKL